MNEDKRCGNCKHRDLWEGLCTNSESESFTYYAYEISSCEKWKKRKRGQP